MSTDARKRQWQRLKREQKKRQAQRAQANPYQQATRGGEVVACYINRDWRDDGIVSLHVLRRRADGGHTMAAFLIDRWCIGLKDAFGHLSMSPSEFREGVVGRISQDVELQRVDVKLALRLVAGSIRFSHQNGFRLPRKWDRWTAVLGDIGDWKTADLSDFGVEGGKLRFVGNIDDLRKRLIGTTVEQFVDREDVEWILGPPLGFLDEDPLPEMVEETIENVSVRTLEQVRRWCFAHHQVPSPRLPEVVDRWLQTSGMFISELGDRPSNSS